MSGVCFLIVKEEELTDYFSCIIDIRDCVYVTIFSSKCTLRFSRSIMIIITFYCHCHHHHLYLMVTLNKSLTDQNRWGPGGSVAVMLGL